MLRLPQAESTWFKRVSSLSAQTASGPQDACGSA